MTQSSLRQIAELGATDSDWRTLAAAAAAALQLPVAAAAFDHLRDEAGRALVARVGDAWRGGASLDLCTAEVLAYQARAARPHRLRANRPKSLHPAAPAVRAVTVQLCTLHLSRPSWHRTTPARTPSLMSARCSSLRTVGNEQRRSLLDTETASTHAMLTVDAYATGSQAVCLTF